MTTVLNAVTAHARGTSPGARTEIRVALLGLGHVGSAIAELAAEHPDAAHRFPIVSALVRNVHRPRPIDVTRIPLTDDPQTALASGPDVVVEVLGGLEPARTIVLSALAQGIPVVTANKSLLAAHGDELFDAAAIHGVPMLYEASVLAGVPFLGTFGRRPLAREVTAISGIVNGTSNFILSRMLADRVSFADTLAEAQRAGYAEPDPTKDIGSEDAVEKLCVMTRHFGGWSLAPAAVERTGIVELELQDLQLAATFGGRIRPIVQAHWDDERLCAFAGPAFVDAANPLADINGVQNAVSLRSRWSGELFLSGPGAGPAITAATVLDDAVEASEPAPRFIPVARRSPRGCTGPSTGWFIRLTSPDIRGEHDAPTLLSTLGVRLRRTSGVTARNELHHQWIVTHPCGRDHLAAALDVLSARYGCRAFSIRAID
jgi:homoserine dehydrogenase